MKKHPDNAKVFMAFCDETRLKILELLRSGETYAGALVEQLCVKQLSSPTNKLFLQKSVIYYHYQPAKEQGRKRGEKQ